MSTFSLPDVGEGLVDAEILNWTVKPGDVVQINDILVEVETAKAVVELPSPFAGRVDTLHVEEGETVPVGTPLVTIVDTDAPQQPTPPAPGTDTAAAAEPVVQKLTPAPEGQTPAAESADDEPAPQVLVGSGPTKAPPRKLHLPPRGAESAERPTGKAATPPLRALAKRLGVDLDVLMAVTSGAPAIAPAAAEVPETRTPIKGVRKAMAQAMTRSAFTAPHVTEWLQVDVTATMELVRDIRGRRDWEGVRVSPLALVAKALLIAAQRHPEINSSWDDATQEIVVKHTVNLGFAVASPRGLLVPNIKGADRLGFRELASSLDALVATARSGRTTPEEMSRGSITITNIGALGVDGGTPILNPGEAAILAFGAIRRMPWVVGDQVVPRDITTLALSFDHRLVDGALGSNVLTTIADVLSNPGRGLLYS